MYVPAAPAPSAPTVAPPGILSSALLAAPPIAASASTGLGIRRVDLNVLEGHAATVSGTLLGDPRSKGLSGRVVTLQGLAGHGWRALARARTSAGGRFHLRYFPHRIGSEPVRLRFAGDTRDLGMHRRLGQLNVYRVAGASWYGGAGGLACGGSLTSSTLGVANKTLPCGTLVTLRYGGRSVRVPVVDRGPYVAGREFDLTQATKQALGFGDTGAVWSTR
jgi:peptidoglycan lytic transglycosylase